MKDLTPFINEVQSRIALHDILGSDVKLKRRGHNYIGCCPFHKEKTPSFHVYDDNNYHCFGCGAHGDIFTYLQKKRGFTFMEALEYLASSAGLTIPKTTQKVSTPSNRSYEIMENVTIWMEENLKRSFAEKARDYVTHRGVNTDMQRQFRLGYVPGSYDALYNAFKNKYSDEELLEVGLIHIGEKDKKIIDRFRNRLMFPIFDKKGKTIAFGGRILEDGQPKYLNSPDTPLFLKSKILYAHHLAQKNLSSEQGYLVVEGYMDVITLHQHGFNTAVAALGTAFGEDHCALLWRHQASPILCFDGDHAGYQAAVRAAMRALPIINADKRLKFAFLPKGEDPDTLVQKNKDAFKVLLDESKTLSTVLWDHLKNSYPIHTPEDQAYFKKNIKELLSKITDVDMRQSFELYIMQQFQKIITPAFVKTNTYKGKESFNIEKRRLFKPKIKDLLVLQKIILATLIKNTYLISEVADKLTYIDFDDSLKPVCDYLISCHENENQDIVLESLSNIGLDVRNILDEGTLQKAPFICSKNKDDIKQGWQEIYDQLFHHQHVKDEMEETVKALKSDFDEVNWNRIKQLQSLKLKGQMENE